MNLPASLTFRCSMYYADILIHQGADGQLQKNSQRGSSSGPESAVPSEVYVDGMVEVCGPI